MGDDPDPSARAAVAAPNRQEEEQDAMWMLRESAPPLVWSLLEASDRVMRDVAAAAAIILDYWSLRDRSPEGWSGAHQRSAERLLRLCQCNMGVYIKLGQHVAQLDYLLPEEYTRTLAPMTRKAPVSPLQDVRETIRKDLGAYPEELFQSFEEKPIASASLAQVHRAVLKDGRQVAVKVQHAGLRERSVVDVMTIDLLVGVVRRVFPQFEYSWLVDEVKRNLPRELDFRLEARNIEAFRRRFEGSAQVAAPVVVHEHTARRVLTMSFEPGVYVDDLQALQRQDLDVKAVADGVFRVFNEQIFVHGEVHCDPHGGNVLVRPYRGPGAYQRAFMEGRAQVGDSELPPVVRNSSGKVVPELVVLDHGLYRRYDDDFRLTYAELWRSLIFSDEQGIKKHAQALQAGELYPLFAAMLTTKQWDEVLDPSMDSLLVDSSQEGKKKTATNAREYMDGINHLLKTIPRDLLLLLKTNDNLRALDASLGHPSNPYMITAQVCVKGAHDARRRKSKTWGTWWAAAHDEWAVWAGLQAFEWQRWWKGGRVSEEDRKASAEEGKKRS